MKIHIDRPRCAGHARCNAAAGELFPLDSDGYIDSDGFDVLPRQERLAARGARACPERIITILDDTRAADDREP
ncbi:MAG: ferredoxin [Phenylobacterium sp.]|nr:ferredoxin [Phenylobacterium sp.]